MLIQRERWGAIVVVVRARPGSGNAARRQEQHGCTALLVVSSRAPTDFPGSQALLLFAFLRDHKPSDLDEGAACVESIGTAEGIQIAIDAIENGRLALVCGAGLSMAAPSNIASAQVVADRAKERYEAAHGAGRPPLSSDIEEQAAFFYNANQLGDYYLRTLVGPHAFSADPNSAHYAVADFLLTRAADVAVSTNVDQLIETAGTRLRGHIEAAVDRDRAAAAPGDTSVLLKLHGCWGQDRDHTLWCKEQLQDEPLRSRVPANANWVENRLLDRDLIVIGYFTHWEHLTAVLETALQAVRPARLIIVDPAEPAWLEQKAPRFYAVGGRAGRFCHVREYGDAFLDKLRNAFSQGFIRKAIHGGRQTYRDTTGNEPQAAWLEPGAAESKHLWRVRRDLEGSAPEDPALLKAPPNEPLVGLTILQFRAAGATWTDSYLAHGGEAIRIFRGSSQPIHALEAKFERVTPPLVKETIVAVGSENLLLKNNVARGSAGASIIRGSGRRWITRADAQMEYGL